MLALGGRRLGASLLRAALLGPSDALQATHGTPPDSHQRLQRGVSTQRALAFANVASLSQQAGSQEGQSEVEATRKLNLCNAVNEALFMAMESDPK